MSDPYAAERICVTIKIPESEKWAGDNPWFVFEGTTAAAVRQQIIDAFGMEADESLTLFDVVVNAERHAVTVGKAAHALGGTILKNSPPESQEAGETAGNGGSDVWSQVNQAAQQPAADKPAADPILASIDAAKTVDELKQIWAENQAAFADAKYMDPWKAKGKSLSA